MIRIISCSVVLCCLALVPSFATDGYFVQGFGAVNSSLGGTATAGNDQDLIGSIYKNPANAVLFPGGTASVAFGDIIPSAKIDSSVAAVHMSDSSKSTVSGVPYLSLMASWQSADTRTTWFVGAVSEAGLSFHAASSTTNPVFFMQSGAAGNPFGGLFGGFGDVRSTLYVVRFPIGLAKSGPDRWSWGISIAPSVGRNLFTPAAFAAPGFGANLHPVYAAVQQVDMEWGFGAQAGLRCQVDKDLSVGVSLSSPTWFNKYQWSITDPNGASRNIIFKMNRPLTGQVGINYTLSDATHLLADLGYMGYGSTDGFAHSGFNADGSMKGLGWKDAYTFELGIQHALTPSIMVRAGYNYCSDPIPSEMTFYNVGSPLHIAHHLSGGFSVAMGPGARLDFSYTHGFAHSQSSSWYNTTGAVPGTNLTSTIEGDEVALGVTWKF